MAVNPLLVALVSPSAESFEASYGWNPFGKEERSAPLQVVDAAKDALPAFKEVSKVGLLGVALASVAVGAGVCAGVAALVGPKVVPYVSRAEAAKVTALGYALPATALTLTSLALMPSKVVVATKK